MKKIFVSMKIMKGDTDKKSGRLLFIRKEGASMNEEIKIANWTCTLPHKTQKQKIESWNKDRFMHSFIERANNQGAELLDFICKGDSTWENKKN